MEKGDFNDELLDRKLSQMFGDASERDQAMRLLREVGTNRVRLCVLKLAGTEIDKLRQYVECANTDFRDVIAWAEYPEQIQHAPGSLSVEESKQVLLRDRQQFSDWLDA